MADFEQSRLSTKLTGSLALENRVPAAGSLSVRLWKKDDSAGSAVRPDDPARILILDLISTSHGVVSQPGGPLVSATFPGVAPAILAARRVQWAIQGLAQFDPAADLAVAILVNDTDDRSGPALLESAQASLDHAAPGQILVSAKAADDLKDFPSLPLQAVPDSALYELVWNGSAVLPSRSLDEEAIEALIKRHGLETEAPPVVQEPVKPVPQATREVKVATRETKAVGAYPTPAVWEQPEPEPRPAQGMNPRLLYGGGGGVLVLIAIVAFFAFSHSKQSSDSPPSRPTPTVEQASPVHQSAQPAQKGTKSKPTASPGSTASSTGQQQPPAGNASDGGRTAVKEPPPVAAEGQQTQAREQQKEQPKEKAAGCSMELGDIPKLLGQADNNRAAGRYEDAVRQYNRVLACGENSRARNGLEITHLAMQH